MANFSSLLFLTLLGLSAFGSLYGSPLPLQESHHIRSQPDDFSSSSELQHSVDSDVEPMDQNLGLTELKPLFINSTESNGEESEEGEEIIIIFLRDVGNSTESDGNSTVTGEEQGGNSTESLDAEEDGAHAMRRRSVENAGNGTEGSEEDDSIFNTLGEDYSEESDQSGNTTSNGNSTASGGNSTESASGQSGNSTATGEEQGGNSTESLGQEDTMLRRSLGKGGNSTESNAEEDNSIFNTLGEDYSEESGNSTISGGSETGNGTVTGGNENGNGTLSTGMHGGNTTEAATDGESGASSDN